MTISGTFKAGNPPVVKVHDGRRGPKGPEGPDGPKGDQGDSINVRGQWVTGLEYCPLDAVSWRSSLVAGIKSLYVQKSTEPCAASTTAPHEDLSRWEEIGAVDWDSAFGGIWEVTQLGHGFTMVGQPVGYSFQANGYVLASARNMDELAIAVVREVVTSDRVVLQSSGELQEMNPGVIWPPGSSWDEGRVYYVSQQRGYVETSKPIDSNYFVNPILIPTRAGPGATRDGVALPWTPSGGPGASPATPVGKVKFYFTASAAQTDFTGADDNANDLAYFPGENTEVFLNGTLLAPGEYTAADGVLITLASPASATDLIEIWTADRPLELLVPSTAVKLDNIASQFNGTEDTFKLLVSAASVEVTSAVNMMVWLDGNAQEPLVDYTVAEDPGEPGTSNVVFTAAPEAGSRFWATLFAPSSGP